MRNCCRKSVRQLSNRLLLNVDFKAVFRTDEDFILRVAGYGRVTPDPDDSPDFNACFTERYSPHYYQECRGGCSKDKDHPT